MTNLTSNICNQLLQKEQITIVKIGGNIISNTTKLQGFLKDFASINGPKVLVHGGGKIATELAKKLGIEPKMYQGRRITDPEMLDVITMVYGGLTSKKIVAQLQGYGCNAIGLSGADANTVLANKRPLQEVDFGLVGDIERVNSFHIKKLLEIGLSPVFCAISHDGNGQLFNTNADTIAAEIAIGLSEFFQTKLYYCFEKNGVLMNVEDENSMIPYINKSSYRELQKEGIIADGMLPKLHNCFNALQAGVEEVYIGNIEMISNQKELTGTVLAI